jgi:hypothetical protein
MNVQVYFGSVFLVTFFSKKSNACPARTSNIKAYQDFAIYIKIVVKEIKNGVKRIEKIALPLSQNTVRSTVIFQDSDFTYNTQKITPNQT